MPEEPFKKKESSFANLRPVESRSSSTGLRTMREDIATLSQHGRSPADMVAPQLRGETHLLLGQKEQIAREFASARRWRIAFIGGVVAALFIGIGTIGFFLFFSKTLSPPEETAPVFLPFPAARQEEIRFRLGDREGLLGSLNQTMQRPAAAGVQQPLFLSFRLFSLDVAQTPQLRGRQARLAESRQASVFEVFQTLRLRPSPQLLQTFTQEFYPYILARALVLVIPITNPQKALEGFLAWEPLMGRDFAPLLSAQLPPPSFQDRVIHNIDARVSSSVSYALFGGRWAIIALSPEALEAALEYLARK